MGTLISHVHVFDDRGESHAFGPDDELPEWAARLMGAHCFVDGVHPFPDAAESEPEPDRAPGQEPPRAGRGSSRDAWVAYAVEKGVAIEPDDARDAIVAKVDAALAQQ